VIIDKCRILWRFSVDNSNSSFSDPQRSCGNWAFSSEFAAVCDSSYSAKLELQDLSKETTLEIRCDSARLQLRNWR
jgi:hypothetical protein